ncbi:ERV/ALR sulfhydryl oxidase domain-containing protein [Halteromyces radiatus]|uniref:ERV/ALR sulfhydryl oxidase domain-containing protein n=1 Tax=Halteromyces radiatus TaxID=101107 RepID=UPI00221F1FA9|nr:ERV/ALR sulfhydryl oxidase domain-containing protein [Halteromyces radiatus]KAI8081378.1 ERV/ALR sulfhydryl oxidase domain-containing protein [Halteromyces radiatus]
MKRITLITIVTFSFLVFSCSFWFIYFGQHDIIRQRFTIDNKVLDNDIKWQGLDMSQAGGVIMEHMGNATAKAELGRATWKLFHTMMARYPEEPSNEERTALAQFIHLLSRLYPCGECAEHFQKLIQKYPPQTSSRIAASQWACAMHNKVNERLGKPIFDCSDLDAKYPCGCES